MGERKTDIFTRSARYATRYNRRMAKRYPLFADQFATTPQAALEVLVAWERQAEEADRQMEQFDAHMRALGDSRRAAVAAVVSPEVLAGLDAKYERIFAGHRASSYADFWWQAVKCYAPEYAQSHCPNAIYHDTRWWPEDGRCPTCGAQLAEPAPVAETPVQLALGRGARCSQSSQQ